MPKPTWTATVKRWQDYLRSAGAPETTVSQRGYHVTRLGREVGGTPGSLTFEVLTQWLADNNWAPNTRRSYRGSLRSFYSWAMLTGQVAASPAHLLPPVKVPRGRPRPAPEAAYRVALMAADDRTRLAILLAAQCGLRRGEISQARTDDVEADLIGHSLRVVGKGGHVRAVPLSPELAGIIARRPDGWLFPSSHGGHLTPHHLGKLVSRCLPGRLTTHTLRHRCATVSYAATHDLRAVQELLGHAKPETTAIYTQIPDASVRAAMNAAAAA